MLAFSFVVKKVILLGISKIKCLVFFSYVQFPSRSSYDSAMRAIAKKGRLYRLERVINPFDKTNRVPLIYASDLT